MNKKISSIFEQQWLWKVFSVKKIDIWFTNIIYEVNEKFIVKICKKIKNQKNFEKEVFLYKLFSDKIQVPKIIHFDKTKKYIKKYFYICNKIEGDNLYSTWHLLKEPERKNIIKKLCDTLKVINSYWIEEYKNEYQISDEINWEKFIVSGIKKYLKKVKDRNILEYKVIEDIENYVSENKYVLKDKKIWIVYWDAHFDNILVKDSKIVWILDFEWMELMSIDYVLDLVFRMEKYPHIYVSKEENEKLIDKEHYKNLVTYYKEFYPELFDFKEINKRVALYSIRYDLRLLLKFPKVNSLKMRLLENLKV